MSAVASRIAGIAGCALGAAIHALFGNDAATSGVQTFVGHGNSPLDLYRTFSCRNASAPVARQGYDFSSRLFLVRYIQQRLSSRKRVAESHLASLRYTVVLGMRLRAPRCADCCYPQNRTSVPLHVTLRADIRRLRLYRAGPSKPAAGAESQRATIPPPRDFAARRSRDF
jgi:hypothetical protein